MIDDAKDWLAMVAEMAPRLRAAGIARVKIDGAEIELAPHFDPEPVVLPGMPPPLPHTIRPEPQLPFLRDPVTFGLPPGSPVPRFERDGDESAE